MLGLKVRPSSLLLPSFCTSRWGKASTMNLPRPSSIHVQFVLVLAKPIPVLPVVLTEAFLVTINPDTITEKKMFCLTSVQLAKIFAIISDKEAGGKNSVFRCMHLSGS